MDRELAAWNPSDTRLLVFVVLQNLDLNLIADIHQIARMSQTSPRHIGDVQQSIQSPEIHEGSVLGSGFSPRQSVQNPSSRCSRRLVSFLALLAFQQFLT